MCCSTRKNAAEIHQEVIDALFHVDPPMSAEEQKNAFGSALADALDKDCSYDVVQSVHEQIRARIEDHKESKDPEPLEMTAGDVGGILANSGVNDEQIAAFQRECDEQYGENAALNPNNIIENKKFEITTPEVKISIAPENSYMIEARVINGRKYLLIPADDGVEVNGIGVNIPGLAKRNKKKGEKPQLLSFSFFDHLRLALVEVSDDVGALVDAELAAVERDVVILRVAPLHVRVEAVIGRAALVLVAQALLGRLLALAVDLDDALGAERHIRVDKDLEALGLVLQNVVRAAADDDTGALFRQAR